MKPVVSERGRRMPASPIRKLMPLADAARARGVRVYPLNIGQPDLETPPAMRRHLADAPAVFAYSPSAGTPECLATLREYYRRLGIAVSDGRDHRHHRRQRGRALRDDGGRGRRATTSCSSSPSTRTTRPSRPWPACASRLSTPGEDGFHLPPREAWEKARTPRTRMVLLCNPNNPTGTVYTAEELQVVAEFCRDHGLFLVADEVYRELVFDGRKHVSALSLAGFEENVVVVDSLSKRYSACGIRLGCLVTRNRDLYGACLRMAQGRLSPPGLAQLVALGASELRPRLRGRHRRASTRRVATSSTRRSGRSPASSCASPRGLSTSWPACPSEDAEDFAAWMLSDFSLDGATVLVSPAPGFYATPGLGRDEVRIAYVLKKERPRGLGAHARRAASPPIARRAASDRWRRRPPGPRAADRWRSRRSAAPGRAPIPSTSPTTTRSGGCPSTTTGRSSSSSTSRAPRPG